MQQNKIFATIAFFFSWMETEKFLQMKVQKNLSKHKYKKGVGKK